MKAGIFRSAGWKDFMTEDDLKHYQPFLRIIRHIQQKTEYKPVDK
jgi:hypothetical protein